MSWTSETSARFSMRRCHPTGRWTQTCAFRPALTPSRNMFPCVSVHLTFVSANVINRHAVHWLPDFNPRARVNTFRFEFLRCSWL